MRPMLLICLAIFAVAMISLKWTAATLVAKFGWPIAIPILAVIFTYAVLADRREARSRAAQQREPQ